MPDPEVERLKKKSKELKRHLAYVHAQAALQHQRKHLQYDHAHRGSDDHAANQEGPERGQDGPKVEDRNNIEDHITRLGIELHQENGFLPADSQLGLCSLSSGATSTTTRSECEGMLGFKSWTPLG